ncbi:MAG TPA: CDP-alcohol phosphatidyltransferase family protein [Opitutaceae bacterium]|nr:CDP-alcohol phosphatidyltransferase family protein [Opitutaceae bacterium]
MRLPFDVLASLFMAFCLLVLFASHRLAHGPDSYRRVQQQGTSFFLGLNLMNAGYWMLQPIVRWCSRSGVTPAMVTWCSLVPAAAAAISAATGHWGVAAWCLLAAALLDVVDGAVARTTGEASAAGAVLDSVLDRYAEFIFFAGVVVYYRNDLPAQLVTLAAVLGSFLISYSSAKAEALQLAPPRGPMKRSDRLALLVVATAVTPFSLHWLESSPRHYAWPVLVAVTVIAVLANASAIQRFTALAQAAGERSARESKGRPPARRRDESAGTRPSRPSPARPVTRDVTS